MRQPTIKYRPLGILVIMGIVFFLQMTQITGDILISTLLTLLACLLAVVFS